MDEQSNPIDIGAIIGRLAPQAIRNLVSEYRDYDRPALDCIHNKSIPSDQREAGLKRWLDYYKVFQGFTSGQRLDLTRAILAWADRLDLNEEIDSAEKIERAHANLMKACCEAYGKERVFISLASKALWLCYPDSIPIFDNLAKHSLQLLVRFEPNIIPVDPKASEYREFVHYWKQLYERYGERLSGPLAVNDPNNEFNRIKVFDAVLWLLGEPGYYRV